MAPEPLQPFDKHRADTDSLTSCGSTLISKAAEGITNGKLTKDAYAPAHESVRGMCSPVVQTADRAVQKNSQEVTANLAWAAVVSTYWGNKVVDFNTEVDRITSALGSDISAHGASGSTPGDGKTADEEAKDAYWKAHQTFIEDGGRHARAMLRDGPSKGNIELAIEAGALPPMSWDAGSFDEYVDGFIGIFKPPNGDNVDFAIWAGKAGSLAALWPGFAMNTYRTKLPIRPLPPLSPRGPYLSPITRAYPSLRATDWWRRGPGLYPGSPASYTSLRHPLTFQSAPGVYTRWGHAARFATNKVFYPLTAVGGAYDQWSRDANRTDLSDGAKTTRAATRGAVKLGGTYLGIEGGAIIGAKLGGAIGTFVPIPGVGTVGGAIIGSIVGGIVGGVVGSGLADEVADHAVEWATSAYDAVADSPVGTAIEETGDALSKLKFW